MTSRLSLALILLSLAAAPALAAESTGAGAPVEGPSSPIDHSAGDTTPDFSKLGEEDDGIYPDWNAAEADGFTQVVMAERRDDPRTETIRREFVKPVEAAAGLDGTHPFAWALLDLNGDGYNDLVIQSLAPGLRDKTGYEGTRALIYTFDGKTWSLALDAGAMVIGYKDSPSTGPGDAHQIAMVQRDGDGYVLFEWDGTTFVRAPTVDTGRWKRNESAEGTPPEATPPGSLSGGTGKE